MLTNFVANYPVLFHAIIITISLVILTKSADMLIYGISSYAKKLGISDYLIGFLVVAVGTALPELVASVNGAIMNQGEIVFGTIIGSNLFKIPLLALVIFVAGKIKIDYKNIGISPVMTVLLTIIPILLVTDNNLSRIDGLILIGAYIFYVISLWRKEGEFGKIKQSVQLRDILKESFIFLGALVALLLSARYLVYSSTEISSILGIHPFIIGLIIIGIGASTPELMVQIRSIQKQHRGIAIGNVLGSIITNSTFVLGIVAVIKPVAIEFNSILFTSIMMGLGTIYVLYSIRKGVLTLKHGVIITVGYIASLVIEAFI
jgi:cation:H+ antiporter